MKIFKSFTDRLIMFVTVTVATILVGTVIFVSLFAEALLMDQMETLGTQALGLTGTKMETILSNVMMTTKFVASEAEDILNDGLSGEDAEYELKKLSAQSVKNNSNIVGCAVALEPYTIPGQRMFSPYSWIPEHLSASLDEMYDTVLVEGVRTKNLGRSGNDIYSQDWYAKVRDSRGIYWGDPYYDEGGGEFWMCTFSTPLFRPDGRFCGVATADISLSSISELIRKLTPGSGMSSYLVDSQGRIVACSDTLAESNMEFKSVSDLVTVTDDSAADTLAASISDARQWLGSLTVDDEEYMVYTRPIRYTGWDLVIFAPYDAIFGRLQAMVDISVIITVVGLLLVVLVIRLVVRRQTRPIVEFGKSAREIASGNFDAALPVITTRDEMKDLKDSFTYMQKHLKKYMDDLRESTINQERVESELNIAHGIQMGILPDRLPSSPELDLSAYLNPAKAVGGDLYDYFVQDGQLFFVIGDVSGKGVPASLLMSVTLGMFRSSAAAMSSPASIISTMNKSVSHGNKSDMFVTMFVGVLDLSTGELAYGNAGHNPPVLVRRNPSGQDVSFLPVEVKLPIGLFDESYVTQKMTLRADDVLLLYTDGLTEAENASGGLYSEERLLKTVSSSCMPGRSAEAVVGEILGSVKEFVGDTPQSDDLTVLAIRYTPSGKA